MGSCGGQERGLSNESKGVTDEVIRETHKGIIKKVYRGGRTLFSRGLCVNGAKQIKEPPPGLGSRNTNLEPGKVQKERSKKLVELGKESPW